MRRRHGQIGVPAAGGRRRAQQAGQRTLTTFGFSLPDEIATTRVDAFKKANTQVQVKITEGGLDEQQFLSAVASGRWWSAPS